MESCDVTVVLCTYNRADRLGRALDALVAQQTAASFEIIVVDNNSSDQTASVVRAYAARTNGLVQYAFEGRQGLSHARNHGISIANGRLIAFTDDDVRVEAEWVDRIVAAADQHPDVGYFGGKVLPHWLTPPPAWLTQAHWSPLALQDYGTNPFLCSRQLALCLVGANLIFRREVFDRVGLFTPELGRIKDGIGSTEDHDMQLRMWREGMSGLYEPSIVCFADVTADRLQRSYHRRWYRGNGRHCAAMRLREFVPADMGPMTEPKDVVKLFGTPAFVYSEVLYVARRWVRSFALRQDSFFYSNKLRHLTNYVRASIGMQQFDGPRSIAAEIANFARAYLAKRRRLPGHAHTPAG
jgi:glycosyltransferase involved in cell wall biosynthesis